MRRTIKQLIFGIITAGILSCFYACYVNRSIVTENKFDGAELAPFVETDFPYITIPLNAQNLGNSFPNDNVTARGLAIQLGNDSYACFDMDLLRWSVGWTGAFLPMVMPAQVSYRDFFKKNNNELPYIQGAPKIATGMYAGWSANTPVFKDVRGSDQLTEGMYWGPVPAKIGQWKGLFVHKKEVILSYAANGTEILEVPGSVSSGGQTAFTRTFRVGKAKEKLYLNVAEVRDGRTGKNEGNRAVIYQGTAGDSVTIAAIKGAPGQARVIDDQYMVIELPASETTREFTVVIWKGATTDVSRFDGLYQNCEKRIPDYRKGTPRHWKENVFTRGVRAADTAAFVTDILTLPLPNPWKRNVRVADIGFFSNGDAAVSTYEGDVWILEGVNKNLDRLKWRRFASGFYEPMSIEVFKDQVYIYAKEGIVRLHDLNGDGEADYYENFCNLMQQSTGTREWAADMVADRDGNFYIAKGGHVTGFKGVLPYLSNMEPKNVYRASTQQSGSVIKISPDGKKLEVIATGLRMPYIGLNRSTGFLSASDQQGNFVQATPIYHVRKGDYFGVPVTKHREGDVRIADPLTWIPHRVDRSAAAQTWIENGKMGPLNNQMIHFSFGRPGAFRVLFDSSSATLQGGVVAIKTGYPSPVLKGEVNPSDGQLYIAGFHNFASNSTGISSLLRMRYTGLPSYMINRFHAGEQGVILSFDSPLDAESVSAGSFLVKRWNYRRTSQYGSGHYRLDGTPGEEFLPVAGAFPSEDKKQILLVIPDMDKAEQMEILYRLATPDGKPLVDGVWFTVNELSKLELSKYGFGTVDVDHVLSSDYAQQNAGMEASRVVSAARGAEIFREMACIGCHSPGLSTDGMYGPPFQDLFGSVRQFQDGTSAKVTVDYLKEAILDPPRKVVKGYNAEMPSYAGVLSEPDLESVILYIKSLSKTE